MRVSSRTYPKDRVCGFPLARAPWNAFGNFRRLPVPIRAGSWTFTTSEALYQAAKFATRPDVQQRIAEAATPRDAAAIGRTRDPGVVPGDWDARRADVMRWVLRRKREANAVGIDALLAATGDWPIVEVSTRDRWWGAAPVADRYEGHNVLGRLWMELRGHLRDADPLAHSHAWATRIRIGSLADADQYEAAPRSRPEGDATP